jgi:kynurenine formamidase
MTDDRAGPGVDVSAEDFRALFKAVSTWGRWGRGDQEGALHYLTPARVAAAAALVRDGVTVTLSRRLDTRAAAHNPDPAIHHMTMLPDTDIGSGSLRFAKDYIGVDYHSDTHSRVDALCHVAFEGSLHNGRPAGEVTSQGAAVDAIEVLEDGLVGAGVLLDIPRQRNVSWVEPGEHVLCEDLEAAERAQGVTIGEGDVLLIRTGHARRLAELGTWDTAAAKAGLHPTAMPYLAERRVTAIGSDGNSDMAPSTTEGVAFPIHVLALNAMGVHLLDYMWLDRLVRACEHAGGGGSGSSPRRCGSSAGPVPPQPDCDPLTTPASAVSCASSSDTSTRRRNTW